MNCKPGDLARVVSNGMPHVMPEILDRIVEVLRPAVTNERLITTCGLEVFVSGDGGPAWIVSSPRPLPGRCSDGKVRMFRERCIGDEFLRPIGGVPVTDDVEDEVTT